MANSNNLLNFVNNASSSIHDALDKPPKKKRVVNVRKFVQGRVKRLDNARPRGQRATQLGSKSTVSGPFLTRVAWPDNSTTPTSSSSSVVPSVAILADREVSTLGYPTTTMSTNTCDLRSYSEQPNMSLSPSSSQPIDPELESLLSSLESPRFPLSRHDSFESVYNSTLSCTPPRNASPEAQVYIPEQAYSPYSDLSTDDLDSAYSSPIESVRLSYNCSPTGFTTIGTNNATSSLPTWTSPLNCGTNTNWLPAVSSNCVQEMAVVSSACDWISSDPLINTSGAQSVYDHDQGPPMTPTVSQLLEEYNQY